MGSGLLGLGVRACGLRIGDAECKKQGTKASGLPFSVELRAQGPGFRVPD